MNNETHGAGAAETPCKVCGSGKTGFAVKSLLDRSVRFLCGSCASSHFVAKEICADRIVGHTSATLDLAVDVHLAKAVGLYDVVTLANVNRMEAEAERFEAERDAGWSVAGDTASLSQEEVDSIYC